MLSKGAAAYDQIARAHRFLTEGTVVSIDPSIGSTSSMPGWAVYKAGKLVASSEFDINPEAEKWARLQRLVYCLRKLYAEWEPDVLVYEDIPAQRHGGGNAVAHASLLYAVGAILSVSGPDYFVGMHPLSWKKMVRDTYVKGDREDAEEIGYIAIAEAPRIREEEDRRYGRKQRSKEIQREKRERERARRPKQA